MVKILKISFLAIIYFLGALFAFGSLIAIRFERQGFGSSHGDWYIPTLFLGFLMSIGLPLLISYLLFSSIKRKLWIAAISIVIAFLLLGLSISD